MFLVIIAVSTTLAAAIAFVAFGRDRSLMLWASALALHTMAYSLFSLRGQISDVTSIVLGNITLSTMFALFAEGIYRFQQRRSPKWLVWLPVAIVAVSFYVLLAELRARIIVGGIIFAAQSLIVVVVLMSKRRQTVGGGQYILAAGAIVASVVFVFRSAATAFGSVETLSITTSNQMQAGTFMMSIISLILLTIGLVVMTKEQAEASERRGKLFTQGILDSVSNQIAVLDRLGVIVSVNEPWRQFSLKNGEEPGKPASQTTAGTNYLEVCGNDGAAGSGEASDVRNGIQAVMEGRLPTFTLEYPCHSPTEQQWFTMTVTSLDSNEGGAVVVRTNITARKLAEEKLRLAANVFTHAYEGITLTSASGEIVDVNEAFSRITGYTRDEVLGQNPRLLSSGRHNKEFYVAMWRDLRADGYWSGEIWNKRKDGEIYPELLTISAVRDDQGTVHQYVGLFTDITRRKQIEGELKESEERFRLMFDRAMDGIVILSDRGKLLAVNEAFARMHGYTPDEMTKLHLSDLDTPETVQGLPEKLARILAGESLSFEVTHYHKDGRLLLLEVSSSLIIANGQRLIQAFHRDITERRHADELVRELAYYDSLTGLANRMLLKDRLTQSTLSGQRSGNYGALMFLDMDNFKPLNDQHGHGAGDLLLAEVARRLKSCVRQIDTVARFGGDEFVVLLDDLTSDKEQAHFQAELVAGKIRSLLADPYVLQTVSGEFGVPQTIEHKCTASIGVALFLGQEKTGEEILKWADLAMYNAKDAGRNTVCFCDAQMWSENTTRQILEEDLHNAVLKKQFCVYFQAQFDRRNRVIGADALLRWQHPSRGWVSPREFIPKAERTGLILPMGLWVLESACVQLALWAKRAETADLTVTVNVSGRQLVQRDFVERVMDTLARTGAKPQRLKLEMKESVLIADVESVIAKISALKVEGIGISLDDFGKGYSSLSSLNRLPLDQIKIDQDFVRDILIDPDDAAIAKMVVALADSMEVAVIAEGVETQAQRDFLAGLGCHKYQGHLLSPALPAHEFEELLARLRA